MKSSTDTKSSATLSSENQALQLKVTSETKEKDDTAALLDTRTQELQDVSTQLSFFAVNVSTSSLATPVRVTGVLGGGGANPYSILTSKSILLYVKNSRDSKVDEILKPLVASSVELVGTRTSLPREIVVSAINGTSVTAPVTAPSGSSTPASSTSSSTPPVNP